MRRQILIVGSGAREHALAWKLRQSPDAGTLFVAPGNAGTAQLATNVPVASTDIAGIARFVEEHAIDLTVVGPEAPLALGLTDLLREQGHLVVGPDAGAARLESSKSFAKEVMVRAGVPTSRYETFDSPEAALRVLRHASYPLVLKADGLAAGKGVSICETVSEAEAVITAMMVDRVHGTAGERVVVEEALSGPEVSLIALVAGDRVVPFPVAQDHKRLNDGDRGPNTGGMGAYAPVLFVEESTRDRMVRELLEPVIAELRAMGVPYSGILFAGLMLTADGPRVLEFNCRFGDPEAQVILPLQADDLLPWLEAAARAGAEPNERVFDMPQDIALHGGAAVGVVLAAHGYPEKPRAGDRIEGLDDVEPEVLVFHAGTAREDEGSTVTTGGRVLTIVGMGSTVDTASRRAYGAPVRFSGMQRRHDIGRQALAAPEQTALPAIRPKTAGSRIRMGVLASGNGSNLQALIDACPAGDVDAEIAAVISSNPSAYALDRARAAGIPALSLPLEDRNDLACRRAHEERILEIVRSSHLDLVVLAGWMLIFSESFLYACSVPIINVHPALLPMQGGSFDESSVERDLAFSGLPVLRGTHAVRDALTLGLPYTGVSVHHVTAEVDAGPVIVREVAPILAGDDEHSLYTRIKPVEHRLLVQAVQSVIHSSSHSGGVHA